VLPDCAEAETSQAACARLALALDARITAFAPADNPEAFIEALRLIEGLAGFSMHVGRRRRTDEEMLLLHFRTSRMQEAIEGGRQRVARLSDARNASVCSRTTAMIHKVNALYEAQGFRVRFIDHWYPTILSSCRGLEILPYARERTNCEVPHMVRTGENRRRRSALLGPSTQTCKCLQPGQWLPSGWSILNADVELFVRLRGLFPARGTHVFVIGNAFGYSSIVLGLLFGQRGVGDGGGAGGGRVDAVDAEVEGGCNHVGTLLTRTIANSSRLDLQVTIGLSPQNVAAAMFSDRYDLALIDGDHTNAQIQRDFAAVEPRLAPRAVVVLHDIGFFDLDLGVARLPLQWHRHVVRGRFYKNLVGTVLMHRGFSPGTFGDF